MSKHQIVFGISVMVLFCIYAIESCETPEGISGICVELQDCPVLMARFYVNPSDPYLKQCACGLISSDVCCPLFENATTSTTTTTTTPRTTTTTTTTTTPRTTAQTVPSFRSRKTKSTTTTTTSTTTTPKTPTIVIPERTNIPLIINHRNIGLINHIKCGPYSKDRLYGGSITSLYQFKWNVMLLFKSTLGDEQLKFMCGGSLIADQYVLSAAHCAVDAIENRYELFSVRVGEWDQSTEKDCVMPEMTNCAPPVQNIRVESYKVHEMYNDALSVNDIMVIKLEHKVKYARNIKTICLPTNENEILSKSIDLQKLTISGWGKTEHKKISNILLYADIPYLPLEKCKETMIEDGIETILYESHICAGGHNLTDSCQGDSGGPLFGGINKLNENGVLKTKSFQFGIVSVGVGCRNQGVSPGVYTNVAYYMNWILDQMD